MYTLYQYLPVPREWRGTNSQALVLLREVTESIPIELY